MSLLTADEYDSLRRAGQNLLDGGLTLPRFLAIVDATFHDGRDCEEYRNWKTFHDNVPAYWDEIDNGSGVAEPPKVCIRRSYSMNLSLICFSFHLSALRCVNKVVIHDPVVANVC